MRSAASAPEGLQVMRPWRPDVLLADVEMPIEDGYSLIAQDRMKALQAGFQFHGAKPVQPAELATVVATLKSTTLRPR